MQQNQSPLKVTALVVLGNILEYYDFLLFAHLGAIITPLYFPGLSSKAAHILSLLLFGLSFIIRPLGGFVFGSISDLNGRKAALVKSIKWAIIPTLGLACLPSYETLGIAATTIFILLRLFQGFALGGEYPNAGTYLMEYHKTHQGFVSGLLAGSGTIGSLLGFGMAFLCLQENTPPWLWRVAFLLGGMAGGLSLYMRIHLSEISHPIPQNKAVSRNSVDIMKWIVVLMIGVLVGTSNWLPTTYSNFYITKILDYPVEQGMLATLVALLGYIVFAPLSGILSDRFGNFNTMLWWSVIAIPVSLIAFFLLSQGNIAVAQLCLIVVAAGFGAPIHAVMNSPFPTESRGRMVGLFFTAGLSLGGLAPSIVSYIVSQTGFQYTPAIYLSCVAALTAFILYKVRSLLYAPSTQTLMATL